MHGPYVVVVDPYYSHLVSKLKADGHQLIAVYSDYELKGAVNGIYSVDKSLFEAEFNIGTEAALASAVSELSKYNITSVVNGFDTGCALWVRLSNALGFPHGPSAALADVLGNKYRTANHVREKGITVARSILVTSANARHCIPQIETDISYPLVIKPTESAGSFGVHICNDRRETEAAIELLLDKADVYGNVVAEVVAEELLRGPEYSVCSVSSKGLHAITAVFTYEEYLIEGVKFARSVELVDPNTPEAIAAIDYAKSILDAIGYQQGQAYTEIILTHAGPRLVEFNPRVAGLNGVLDVIAELCTGNSQVALTSMSCAPGEHASNDGTYLYEKRGHGKLLFLRNYEAATVRSLDRMEQIKALASVRQMKVRVKPGDHVPATTDVLSAPGHIVMCHPEQRQLQEDIDAIGLIEREGLFG